jgi:hypothetical protein
MQDALENPTTKLWGWQMSSSSPHEVVEVMSVAEFLEFKIVNPKNPNTTKQQQTTTTTTGPTLSFCY